MEQKQRNIGENKEGGEDWREESDKKKEGEWEIKCGGQTGRLSKYHAKPNVRKMCVHLEELQVRDLLGKMSTKAQLCCCTRHLINLLIR